MTRLAWGSNPVSGAPFEGKREIGDQCPNCGYPTDLPTQGVFPTVIEGTPSSGSWTCSHCGWEMRTARHEAHHDNRTPGFPLGPT